MRPASRLVLMCVLAVVVAVPASAQQRTWVSVESVNQVLGSSYANVVALADGRVLAEGGLNQYNHPGVIAAVFDGIRSWTPTAGMPTGRYGDAMTLLQDGRAMALGGVSSYEVQNLNCIGSPAGVEFYDPASNAWTVGPSMPDDRVYPRATTLNDGRVLVVGGFSSCSYAALTTADLYDPKGNSWTTVPMNTTYGESLYDYQNTKLFILGDGRVFEWDDAAAEIFDPATNTWGNVPVPHSFERMPSTVAVLGDGRLLVTGGIDGVPAPNGSGQLGPSLDETTSIFDPVKNQWSDAAPIPRFPFGGVAMLQSDGTVLVSGTFEDLQLDASCNCQTDDNFSPYDGSTFVYSPSTNTWRSGPVMQFLNGSPFMLGNTPVPAGHGNLLSVSNDGYGSADVYRVVTPPTAIAANGMFPGVQNFTSIYPADASASFDADGDSLVQFAWSEGGTVLATSTTPTATVQLGTGTHALTLTVTDATGQTGSTGVTETIYDPTAQLQSELDAAITSLNAANAQIATLIAQLSSANAQLSSLQTMLASALSDPSFVLPGATLPMQIQNLVGAIQQLNHGEQQALYKNLGGTK